MRVTICGDEVSEVPAKKKDDGNALRFHRLMSARRKQIAQTKQSDEVKWGQLGPLKHELEPVDSA